MPRAWGVRDGLSEWFRNYQVEHGKAYRGHRGLCRSAEKLEERLNLRGIVAWRSGCTLLGLPNQPHCLFAPDTGKALNRPGFTGGSGS